jgi:ankyrin repeat protein
LVNEIGERSLEEVERDARERWFQAAGDFGAPVDVRRMEQLLLFLYSGLLDVNAGASSDGTTALGLACVYGHTEAAVWLLAQGAELNRFSGRDARQRPLWHAALNGHLDIVLALIANGARVNERLSAGPGEGEGKGEGKGARLITALHAAADQGHAAVVRALLEAGADASIRNADGQTAAELAAAASAAADEKSACAAEFKEFKAGRGTL